MNPHSDLASLLAHTPFCCEIHVVSVYSVQRPKTGRRLSMKLEEESCAFVNHFDLGRACVCTSIVSEKFGTS